MDGSRGSPRGYDQASEMSTTSPHEPAPPKKPERPARSPRERTRTGGLVVLAVLITLFAVSNFDEDKVHWIVGSGRAPLALVIVISLLWGIALTHFAVRRSRP